MKDGATFTNSRDVAAFFGKQHKDVLKRYDNLECSEGFNGRNFAPVDYLDEKGEARRAVDMTRDGFVFIAFGFTGKRAAKFKEDYIARFNEMEATLRAPVPAHPWLGARVMSFPVLGGEVIAVAQVLTSRK